MKKYLPFIIVAFAVISFIAYKVYWNIQAEKAAIEREERYQYTIRYIHDDLENFEKMCEYDLEHCVDYNYQSTGSSKISYYVPKARGPYSRERKALFTELGIAHEGFTDAEIYPDDGMIIFWDHWGYCMKLIYVKDGDIENEDSFDKIGEHFYSTYYYVDQPRG